jgi:predicted AlkP superfamily phosphohydrolase/phosphomutase
MPERAGPVVCIGFDAAEPTLVQEGIDQGWLPALASLLERGRCVHLEQSNNVFSGAAWPTTITGAEMQDHLLFLDRQLEPGSYRIVHVGSEMIGRPPLWRHVSDAGLNSTVVSVYGAPLLDDFLGTQVLGWGSHDPFGAKFGDEGAIEPPEVRDWLDAAVGRRNLDHAFQLPTTEGEVREYVRERVEGVRQQTRALGLLLERTRWDLFFASFAEPHQAGHLLWHLCDPTHLEHDPDAAEDVRAGMRQIYEAVDEGIGELLERLPADTTVLVFTPHGMRPQNGRAEPTEAILERGGWLVRGAGPGKTGVRTWLLRTAWRTARRLLPERARTAVARRVPRETWLPGMQLADVDWTATRAFPVPHEHVSYVRLNLKGREPQGSVDPTAVDAVCGELAEALHELVDLDTGEPAVVEVVRTEEVIGEPAHAGLPDLSIVWADAAPRRRLRSERLGLIETEPEDPRTGKHRTTGFVIGAGPGIEPSQSRSLGSETAMLADLAPTVLRRLGVPVPQTMHGRPLPAFPSQNAPA